MSADDHGAVYSMQITHTSVQERLSENLLENSLILKVSNVYHVSFAPTFLYICLVNCMYECKMKLIVKAQLCGSYLYSNEELVMGKQAFSTTYKSLFLMLHWSANILIKQMLKWMIPGIWFWNTFIFKTSILFNIYERCPLHLRSC